MLSPSDFNNAVPQFTNGNYASNPLNPQYIAEPSSTEYNRGAEPLQTLPAQWWNWFLNRFTLRFNKLNIYVKNIFNELSQLLSLVSETPSGTEAEPTVGQLKDMFETKYPDYLKTTPALSNTYVPQTTMVNGYALSGNVTISCVACAGCNGSGTAFGTASTLNTGTVAGCIPIIGTALGTTNGQFIATDASGCLKPSGYSASSFRSSSWTPSCVSCAGQSYCVMDYCSNSTPLYVGYATTGLNCSQVTYLAAFSTNYISGKTIIKDASKDVIQSWLGLGSAAYCGASAFRSSSWTPSCVACAGYAIEAGSAASAGTTAISCCTKAMGICVIHNNFATSRSGYAWCSKCCNYGIGCYMWLCANGGSVIEAYVCSCSANTFCCYVIPPGAGCTIFPLNASGKVWIKGSFSY